MAATSEEASLADVIADPDDGGRLIFADFLEDRGDAERAKQDVASQQRATQAADQADNAAGIGKTDGEGHETNERDADGPLEHAVGQPHGRPHPSRTTGSARDAGRRRFDRVMIARPETCERFGRIGYVRCRTSSTSGVTSDAATCSCSPSNR